jgi:cytidylate kinase
MADLIITIDGPAASGKSTVARLLAERLGASFLDTGAMYRAVTLAAMKAGTDMSDEQELLRVLEGGDFQFAVREGKMLVSIGGIDVTEQLRRPEVTANARHIASSAKLREKLVAMQRRFAAGEDKIVTEGRDQGTVAFPDADIKFRRQVELRGKGEDRSLQEVQEAIRARDKSDQARAVGPLRPASEAVVVDTTNLSIEEVVERLLRLVKERCQKQ